MSEKDQVFRERVAELDALLRDRAAPKDVLAFCQQCLDAARAEGNESDLMYFGARLASFLAQVGELEKAVDAYEEIWPLRITGPSEGLRFIKLLTSLRRSSRATQVLAEMQERLKERTANPAYGYFLPWETLNLMQAEGLLAISRGDERGLLDSCNRILAHLPRMSPQDPIDTGLLTALIENRHWGLARRLLEAVEAHQKRGVTS